MAQGLASEGWFTRERVSTTTLAIATLLALYVCYRIVEPFIPAIAFALALAVTTQRPYNWLRCRVRNNTLAASCSVVLVAVLIVAPAALLGTYVVAQAVESVNELSEGGPDWLEAMRRQPVLRLVLDWSERHLDLQAQLQRGGEALAAGATGFLMQSVGAITLLVITLFVLFFMYRDQEAGQRALRSLMPLSAAESRRMFSRLAGTIRATVSGSLTVALVQALLAGVMYGLLGVPAALLWGAATFLAALVPLVGTALVWVPIALYLLLFGSWIKALILVGWAVLAVGTIDNFLYPFLVGDKLRIHTVPTFFSILGGLALFGAAGLILGPLALAVTIVLLDIWWWRTENGQAAEEEVADTHTTAPPGSVL
jgi:predicted PurR-regulated permease PerM